MKLDKDTRNLVMIIVLWAVAITALLFFITGCRTIYVPVPEVHTEHHYHTDSVSHTDSIIDHQTTIIREVDSLTMAQYGIRLAQAEKAWLIQSDKLYKEIEKLRASKIDSVFIHDSIPYEVPGPTKYVNELKSWQKGLIWWGIFCTLALIVGIYIRVRFRAH